jgi:hypothetical protein
MYGITNKYTSTLEPLEQQKNIPIHFISHLWLSPTTKLWRLVGTGGFLVDLW